MSTRNLTVRSVGLSTLLTSTTWRSAMSDLVARLRSMSHERGVDGITAPLLREAADALEAAEAQNLALIERLESLQFENLTLREAQTPDLTVAPDKAAAFGYKPPRPEFPDSVASPEKKGKMFPGPFRDHTKDHP